MILKDAHFTVDGVDLSAFVKQLSFDRSVEIQENTTMGSNSRTKEPGLMDASGSVTFKQDYAVGTVDDTLHGLMAQVVSFEIRPKAAAVSTTNPSFSNESSEKVKNTFSYTILIGPFFESDIFC